MNSKVYVAIDLKSFFASVECVERGLDPLNTNLAVADEKRTEKTICLAVSPSLKAVGVGGRCRLFELIQAVNRANQVRKNNLSDKSFQGKSYFADILKSNKSLEIDYIIAPPRMSKYMEISSKIFDIYLKYVSKEDIHSYSIDEVFIDATKYLKLYNCNAHDFAMMLIKDVLHTTEITATAGIGTNLYLCKIAMDIVAKKMKPDSDGVRIAYLDEKLYRKTLWEHTPITDFWRVGQGYAKRLANYNIFTMGDVALCSETNEDLLYKLFGINAQLLIDHAWGYEPCTIKEIKEYKPQFNSICSGQVLSCPYSYEKTKVVVSEMADMLSYDLLDKGLATNQLVLTIGYDVNNENYIGEYTIDRYGRKVPKSSHGSENIGFYTSSSKVLLETITRLFDRIVDKNLFVRKISISCKVVAESIASEMSKEKQISFFDNPEKDKKESLALEKEKRFQKSVLQIRKKYGKNAILTGLNFQEGATAKERNNQIGGHKA